MRPLTKLSFFLAFMFFSVIANAQKSKAFPVSNFNTISVSNGIDLYLSQSNNESVTAKADDADVLNQVVIEQNGAAIEIKFKDGFKLSSMFKGRNAKVYVSLKKLETLNASGGSDVFSANQITTEKLAIRSSGGSDVKLNVSCNNLSLQSSGGSDVKLKGKATNLTIQSSGGSDVNAYDLISDYAKVSSSGGSDVELFVNKGLEASASGGADITYKGNGALKKTSSSKSGSVKHVN